MREIAVVFDPERKLFLYSALVFLVTFLGPFGTYEAMDLWERTIFWSLDILGCMVIIVPILHVFYHSRFVRRVPPLPRFVFGIALGALPGAGYITLLYASIGSDLEITTPYPVLFVQVTIFSTVLLQVEYVLWPKLFGSHAVPVPVAEPAGVPGGPVPPAAPGAATAPAKSAPRPEVLPATARPRPPLLERLPADHRDAEVLSISMQDHYAEVTTSAGTALTLIRLTDAMELMGEVRGVRLHRSHWVALDAVAGIEKTGRRHEVVLKGGRRLPVGQTYLSAVRDSLGNGVSG